MPPLKAMPIRRLLILAAAALCALALSGCLEETNDIRDGVDEAQQTARDAQRLRDAVQDFDRAEAERRVREAFRDGQPVKDASCPLKPRINWDLLAIEVDCTATLDSGEAYTVPVRYTPGAGIAAGRPRQAG
jgi:hypothetical protein